MDINKILKLVIVFGIIVILACIIYAGSDHPDVSGAFKGSALLVGIGLILYAIIKSTKREILARKEKQSSSPIYESHDFALTAPVSV